MPYVTIRNTSTTEAAMISLAGRSGSWVVVNANSSQQIDTSEIVAMSTPAQVSYYTNQITSNSDLSLTSSTLAMTVIVTDASSGDLLEGAVASLTPVTGDTAVNASTDVYGTAVINFTLVADSNSGALSVSKAGYTTSNLTALAIDTNAQTIIHTALTPTA